MEKLKKTWNRKQKKPEKISKAANRTEAGSFTSPLFCLLYLKNN